MSLHIVIPSDQELIDDLTGKDLLNALQLQNTRSLTFFDEHITGYIIAETDKLPQPLIYLDISITPQEQQDTSFTDDDDNRYHSLNYNIGQVVLNKDNLVQDYENCTVWKFEFDVPYPKRKLGNPNLFIKAGLCDGLDINEVKVDEVSVVSSVLKNYEGTRDRNLFGELNSTGGAVGAVGSIGTAGAVGENEVTNSVSFTSEKDVPSPIYSTTISIPVTVSLVLKMKTTKPAGRNSILLATLNIEGSDELNNNFDFDIVDENYCFKIIDLVVEFSFGLIVKFSKDNFPCIFKSIDMVNYTYKLINNEINDHDKSLETSKNINIKLVLQVLKYDPAKNTYSTISNIITTKWAPYIDFFIIAPPINNSLKTSTNYSHMQSQPILPSQGNIPRRVNTNLYKLKSGANNNSTPAFTLHPPSPLLQQKQSQRIASSASSVTVNLTTSNNSALSGLKLTFKGKLSIRLGEIVIWKLQAINNSPGRLNLSLLVQNNINFAPVFNSTNLAISSSNLLPPEIDPSNAFSGTKPSSGTEETKSNILIQNPVHLFSEYFSQKLNTNGVIILDNDVRLGPLEPNGVFETEIKLIGTACGIFNLEGIKIFDITSGDGLDFGKLVEVFVI